MATLRTLLPLLAAATYLWCLPCWTLTPPAEIRQPQNLPPLLGGFNSSSDDSLTVDLPLALRVFSMDYHHVQAPFEIVLWIMLASLAKLGELLLGSPKLKENMIAEILKSLRERKTNVAC